MKQPEDKITAPRTYYKNPDFDEIFIFLDLEVPTSNKRFHQIDTTLQQEIQKLFPDVKELYIKQEKINATDFRLTLQNKLNAKRKKKWPYKGKLLLHVGVAGIKKIYGQKDVDNLLKSVFDAFKGIVFENDDQIELVICSKYIWDQNLQGLTVALSILTPTLMKKYFPKLYSDDYRQYGNRFIERKSIETDEIYGSFEIY
jgi:Holliday junction resolvase RusA-like endonuclease